MSQYIFVTMEINGGCGGKPAAILALFKTSLDWCFFVPRGSYCPSHIGDYVIIDGPGIPMSPMSIMEWHWGVLPWHKSPFFARCIMFKYPFVVREVPWHKSGESVTWGSVTGIWRFVQWLNTAWRAVSCTKTRGKSSRRPAVWKAGRRDFLRWQIVSEFVEVFSSTNKNGATNRRIHRCLVGDSCQWS